MSRIRAKDTTPELVVRRYLHAVGLRFRLHRKSLPGCPDVVFPSKKICVFIHGCFWHGCSHCVDGTRKVKSNSSYWNQKVETNRQRDLKNEQKLRVSGWHVLKIWECQTKDERLLKNLVTTVVETHRAVCGKS